MKVIDLGKSVIFIDDIQYIYEKEVTGEYHDRTEYYIVTKVGKFEVEKFVYKEVKEYLLSLNEEVENIEAKPKEDKRIEKIDLLEIIKNREAGVSNDTYLACCINLIIDKVNGEDNESN